MSPVRAVRFLWLATWPRPPPPPPPPPPLWCTNRTRAFRRMPDASVSPDGVLSLSSRCRPKRFRDVCAATHSTLPPAANGTKGPAAAPLTAPTPFPSRCADDGFSDYAWGGGARDVASGFGHSVRVCAAAVVVGTRAPSARSLS